MKPFYSFFFLFALCSFNPIAAQMSILFVDDSRDNFGNAELFEEAIDSVGYSSVYYHAEDSTSGPSADYMATFDLVLWHTSTIGFDLELWNRVDEDNNELINYLDGGGNLWLVGLDFLYDRYDVPGPTSFTEGDFVFDYLGISSYDAQSNADDGGLGVPFVKPDTNMIVIGLPELTWQFPALNWVDVVQLRPEAAPLYRMGGGENYPLVESICGAYYDNSGSKVVTYLFDLSVVEDFELLERAVSPVLAFFENFTTSTPTSNFLEQNFEVYPNPAVSSFSLEFELEETASVEVSIVDYLGREVLLPVPSQLLTAGNNRFAELSLANLANGVYFVRMSVDGKVGMKPLAVEH
jgi:hypothetical protein